MLVHFDNVSLGSRSGPNTFATRLAKGLLNAGHNVTLDADHADVSLVFIEPTGKKLARKVVQRLDGIWFKPDEFHVKNVAIKSLYEKADAVVFQSSFDKDMVSHWWGTSPQTSCLVEVIHNGIDLARLDRITIPELARIRSSYDKVFVCSSNWHPQKRLKANLKLFEHLRATQFPNSCLFVMGANPDVVVADRHVFYTGSQPAEVYMQVYAAADWMLHLAWADHCPNVVVEALSQGTPVICSEVGGTKELIANGRYGIVLNEKPYAFELADYDSPPDVDVTQVAHLPHRSELSYDQIPNIDIQNAVTRYVQLFERLNVA